MVIGAPAGLSALHLRGETLQRLISMKQNIYDDSAFFGGYAELRPRSGG
jgi:hypothetical protein